MTKYRAKPVEIDGFTFPSTAEGNRYAQLKLLERARQIRGLTLQPRYALKVNGVAVCEYVGDFAYFEGGRHVVEDSKGVMTPVFRLKRKMFMAMHPDIELRITNRKGSIVNVRSRKLAARAA